MTIWYDLTPNYHDGTLVGPVLNTDNGIKSVFFDGVNDYITIDPAPNTSVSNTFTYEILCTANATHEIDIQSTTGFAGNTGQRYIVHPAGTTVSDATDIGISIGTNGVSVYEYIPGASGLIFDTRTAAINEPEAGVGAVSSGAWGSFMNSYAIWRTGQLGTFEKTYTLSIPVTGNYTVTASADDVGNVSIDNVLVVVAGPFSSSNSVVVPITAGQRQIKVSGRDTGGAIAGIAATVTGSAVTHFPPLLVNTTPISNTNFTHIVVVVENKQPKLYINGSLVHTGLTSQKFRIYAQTQRLGGGQFGYFAGKIRYFKLYQCALTPSQIVQRYNDLSNTPTYQISPNTTSLNEGGSVTYTITTTKIPNGNVLYWTTSGSTSPSDFTDSSNTGLVVINSNSGSVTRTLNSDITTEGTETIVFELRTESISGPIVATAATVNVNDTSTSPTYSIVPNYTTITESGTVTYTVTTTNVPNGTVLYWRNVGSTTMSDFEDSVNDGTVTINNNTGTITRTVKTDAITEGTETIILQLRSGSITGTILATATTVNVTENIVLNNFDYAVVRYKWSAENGTDLDTRTALLNTGTVYDNDDVGYDRGNTVGPNPYYLTWGGDNTNVGAEAVLIDFKQIANNYPSLQKIKVNLSSYWYEARNDGNVTLEFETYLGGTMSQSGFDFVNSGGSVVNSLQTVINVTKQESANVDGECMRHLVYNVATKTATLEDCNAPDPYLYLPGDGLGSILYTTPQTLTGITDTMSIAVKMVPEAGWTGSYGINSTIISKWNSAKGTFLWNLHNSGMRFAVSNNGTAINDKYSIGLSNAVSPPSGTTPYWLGVTCSLIPGGSVSFYTSSNGTTWSQLGSSSSVTYTGSIYNPSDTPIRIGSYISSTGGNTLNAKIYRIKIFSGVVATFNTTPILDFDPSLYTGGNTITLSTGQVFTSNGSVAFYN